MQEKVLLVLADGMRPDSLSLCGHPFVSQLLAQSTYDLKAQTVMPSVTLPCHMSLFHSVDPGRHGILSNTYVPQVRPVNGLCDVLHSAGKTCSVFYDWEELRDLWRPGALMCGVYLAGHVYTYQATAKRLYREALAHIRADAPDFVFLYIGLPDCIGHEQGWMTDAYLESIYTVWDIIASVRGELPSDYHLIVTADHGGHDRCHGSELPADMEIPIILNGPVFQPSRIIENTNIKDIAPTIAALTGTPSDPCWEGRQLV